MDKDVLAIALAGFMHDIGKFVQRIAKDSKETLPDDFDKSKYQPKDTRNSTGYSHIHASYTAFFIKNILKTIPEIEDIDKFIGLSAKHHIDSNEKEEFVINIADRISAGMDRKDFEGENTEEIPYSEWNKTRLVSIFDELDEKVKEYSNRRYQYTLSEFNESSIFPEQKTDVTSDYSTIAQGFYKDLDNLNSKNLEDWFLEFDKVNKKWTSFIPSATVKKTIPDISLYDHAKTTSAIAQALYIYHKDKCKYDFKEEVTKESIKSNDVDKKFLYFKAKFNGIQNFIFSQGAQINKKAAKILRGRSFYISLIMKRFCNLLCDELGLAHTAIIMNAAGSVTAILPNTQNTKDKLNVIKEKVNSWLIEKFYGEVSISFAYVEITGKDFVDNLKFVNSSIASKLEIAKFHKISVNKLGSINEYFKEDDTTCKYCGKRPAKKSENLDSMKCDVCGDLISIGEHLINRKNFDLEVPIFNIYKTVYEQDYDNLYVPTKFNDKNIKLTKDFDDIVGNDSKGINALGVLKADIDNLGSLFNKVSQKGGISRQVTFSRMLDAFWTLWLPKKLEKDFPDIYTVFSGGDDLFLIGRWDNIIDFVFELKKCFIEYTCKSSEISFSVGIALIKPGFPITNFYSLSEEALEKSKSYQDEDYGNKNALTIFNTTISLKQIEQYDELIKFFKDNEKIFNTSFLYRVLCFIEMAEKVDKLKNNQKNITLKDMQCLKWRPLLSYFISRNNEIKDSSKKNEIIKELVSNINEEVDRNVLKIVLCKIIYKNRDRR